MKKNIKKLLKILKKKINMKLKMDNYIGKSKINYSKLLDNMNLKD